MYAYTAKLTIHRVPVSRQPVEEPPNVLALGELLMKYPISQRKLRKLHNMCQLLAKDRDFQGDEVLGHILDCLQDATKPQLRVIR